MKEIRKILPLLLAGVIVFAGCSFGGDDDDYYDEYDEYDSYTESEYDEYDDEYEYDETDETNESGGWMGAVSWEDDAYTEPLTDTLVSLPSGLAYYREMPGNYGMVTVISEFEDFSGTRVEIGIEELYAEQLDEVTGRHSLDGGFAATTIESYTGNYLSITQEETSFGEMVYSYHQFCLLTEGNVLHVNAITDRAEMLSTLMDQVQIDFTAADGQLGLVGVDEISIDHGSEDICGIWVSEAGDRWLDSRGGILFSLYDKDGNVLDRGMYDDFWETLEGAENDYSVSIQEDSIALTGDFFLQADTLGIYPANAPAGVPQAGVSGSGLSADAYTPYLGQWENDTIPYSVEINRGSVLIQGDGSYSSGNYSLEDDCLQFGSVTITLTADGGLEISDYEGTFYPKGERESPEEAYLGTWSNATTGDSFSFAEGGVYGYETDGGFGMAGWTLLGPGKLEVNGNSAWLDEAGNMIIDGYDGVFVKGD